jgi:hypothetical protein
MEEASENSNESSHSAYANGINELWGKAPHSINVFRMQKNIIRIMLGCKKECLM